MESTEAETPSVSESDEEADELIYNNSFICGKRIRPDEMVDLGVALLPAEFSNDEDDTNIASLEADENNRPNLDMGSELSPEEYQSHDPKPKRSKTLSPDNFLYKRNNILKLSCKVDYLSILSDEVILSILSHLPYKTLTIVAQVSRRLRRLTRDDSLWPRLDLSNRRLHTDSLGYVLQLGIRVLRMSGVSVSTPVFSPEMALNLSDFTAKVEYLDLSEAVITVEDLAILCSKFRRLKKLSLETCAVNLNVFKEISKNNSLDTLNLCLCTGIDAFGISELKHCEKLESLNLAWTGLSKITVDHLIYNIPPTIKELNLSGMQMGLRNDDVDRIITTCPNITELDLSDCVALNYKIILEIARKLQNLRGLSISRCCKINPSVLVELAALPHFKRLNCFRTFPKSSLSIIEEYLTDVHINKEIFSTIARPTVGLRRTSIWGKRCRE